ncbi:hypothetical protein RUM43_001822 [Polyplax serrata]|uniref:Connector enhancer of kinase suppressor of ras 2 n=1 Tax=Polyplax serrata TaxID=468196 RepID=A0AAN8SKB1_POLSC
MAYVSVAEWRPEQVTEWLKGLDNSIVSYIHWFSNNEVNGQQLLNLSPDELTHLGVYKLGHQELILEAVQQLRNFHYDLDRENLQFLALKLSCAANSLFSEIRDQAESSSVPTQIMADVANVIHNVKPLVSWLDRPPFSGQLQYTEFKSQLLSLSLEMATSAQRDRFAERPVAEIRTCSSKLAKLADSIIQDFKDPMILQPATLDLATIKKRVGEDLDFFLVPSFHGIHQIGDMKLSSPAHQSGKIQQGDEIVQVNYQTVVGWSRKKVLALFEESPNDLLLTLKRRPRHVKMYGQIYMKPYRLPSRKRALPYSRWNDNLPSPRPELLTIPHFDTTSLTKKMENDQTLSLEPSGTSSSSDEEFGHQSDTQSPSSMRLFLPKPRASIQRRFTLSGPPRPSAQSEQFWRELQMERSWRSNQSNSQINKSSVQNVGSKEGNVDEMFQLRDKSASLGNSIASASSRSTTCVPFRKDRIGSVKFDLPKFDSFKSDKLIEGEKDKMACDTDVKTIASEVNKKSLSNVLDTKAASHPTSLSITELNKLKRNAFFNNMECTRAQSDVTGKLRKEGSSDKVKRVVENFKSEINKTKYDVAELEGFKSPGKVMELIESFEKKEILNSRNKSDSYTLEKPHGFKEAQEKKISGQSNVVSNCDAADKNNLSEYKAISPEGRKETNAMEHCDLDKNNSNESSPRSSSSSVKTCIEDYSIGMKNNSVPDVNPKEHQMKQNSSEENISYKENICNSNKNVECSAVDVDCINGASKKLENMNDKIGKSDENISGYVDMDRNGGLLKNEMPDQGNTSGLMRKNEDSSKPIPAQRSKIPFDKNLNASSVSNPFPLPPKPRTKYMTTSQDNNLAGNPLNNQTPPEPPPRPNNTFSKPVTYKRGEIVVEARKNEVKNSSVTDIVRILPEPPSPRGPPTPIPIIVTPEPQVVHHDNTSVSSTPSSPVRKVTKAKNATSSSSSEKEKPKSSGGTLESLKSMLILGRKSGSLNSPRSLRKKSSMLAKKRNVSVKDITPYENSGFLYYRNRKGSAEVQVYWTKHFFVLQGSNFYGFKSKESTKADLFIHLPGFTCSVAEEVKSKDFPFKIYHTGTVFYFAANSKENLQQWLDFVNLAISLQPDGKNVPETVTFSQTDSDSSDTDVEPETCFPTSPKMKKVLGASSLPKPARSHQNLATESKKGHDIQRRFGSLKKLSSRKNSTSSNQFSNSGETTEVASLDRKYLRFLGQKNSPTPVPTSGFRSYRRMNPTLVAPPKSGGKSGVRSKASENNADLSHTNLREPSVLLRKPLHSSNPSLVHPEMADYRITQERLSEFRRLRNQGNPPERSRFMTLEQFLQEDAFRSNRNRTAELGGFITLEQFLLRQEEERQRSMKSEDRPGPSHELAHFEREYEEERRHQDSQSRFRGHPVQGTTGSSNQLVTNYTKKPVLDRPQVAPRNKELNLSVPGVAKNINVHQPQSNSQPIASTSQGDTGETTFMGANRENHLVVRNTSDVNCPLVESDTSQILDENTNLSYEGIEYPPAFEPETYTLQHMLKTRQKRSQDRKN